MTRKEILVDCMSICNPSCHVLVPALLHKVEKALEDDVENPLILQTVSRIVVMVAHLVQHILIESVGISVKVTHQVVTKQVN